MKTVKVTDLKPGMKISNNGIDLIVVKAIKDGVFVAKSTATNFKVGFSIKKYDHTQSDLTRRVMAY